MADGIQVPGIRNAILRRDGWRCVYCSRLLNGETPDATATIDHLFPRCQGGTDAPNNLVACCRSCNSRKGGRTPMEAGMYPKGRGTGAPVNFEVATALMFRLGLTEEQAFEAERVAQEEDSGLGWLMSAACSPEARILLLGLTRRGSPLALEDPGPSPDGARFSVIDTEGLDDLVDVYVSPSEDRLFDARFSSNSKADEPVWIRVGDMRCAELRAISASGERFLVFTPEEARKSPLACVKVVLDAVNKTCHLDFKTQGAWSNGYHFGYRKGFTERGRAIELLTAEAEAAE